MYAALPNYHKNKECHKEVVALVVEQVVGHSVAPFFQVFYIRDLKPGRLQQKIIQSTQRRNFELVAFAHFLHLNNSEITSKNMLTIEQIC